MSVVARTQQAEDDLKDLFVQLGRQRRGAATKVRAAIDRAAKLLARSPGLGRLRPELRPDIRSYPVLNTYIIFYRAINGGIEIARVLHGARDVTTDMFDD
jgi:toxin ParE1/3/4